MTEKVTLPRGWVPLTLTFNGDDQHPEEVAYGPPEMMARLGRWLDKHFARVIAERSDALAQPAAEAAMSDMVTLPRGVAERALEALEKIADWHGAYGPFPEANSVEWRAMAIVSSREAVVPFRAALAQAGQGEAVAVAKLTRGTGGAFSVRPDVDNLLAIYALPPGEHSLYAAPPPAPAVPEEWVMVLLEEAFRDGYYYRSTYSDVVVSDVDEEWAKARARYVKRITAAPPPPQQGETK